MKKLFNYPMLIFLLVGCTFASLLIGVKSIRWLEGWQLNEAEWSIIVHSRLPRTISILLASAALSICGLIMQRLSQNRFVSPSTVGIMDWAKLGMLISLLFFKDSSILLKLTIAIVFTIVGMMLFLLLLNQIPWKDPIIIPLVGLIFGEEGGGFVSVDEKLDANPHGQAISYEYIVEKNPNYLFIFDRGATLGKQSSADTISDNPLVKELEASKLGHIQLINGTNWYIAFGGLQVTLDQIAEVKAVLDK